MVKNDTLSQGGFQLVLAIKDPVAPGPTGGSGSRMPGIFQRMRQRLVICLVQVSNVSDTHLEGNPTYKLTAFTVI